jgi:hypothetical protein
VFLLRYRMSLSRSELDELKKAYGRAVDLSRSTPGKDVIFARSFNCGLSRDEAKTSVCVSRPFEYDSRLDFRRLEGVEARFLGRPNVTTLGYSCCDAAYCLKRKYN